jgi:hypothetical protein
MGVNQEIEEMLNALGDPTPEAAKGEDEEDKEQEEENKEEDKEEEKTEEKAEEKKEERAESDEEKKEEGEDEEEDKDTVIANLRAQLEERSKTSPKEEPSPEKKEEKKEEPLKLDEHDFVGDLDLDDLTRDKTTLNKLLNAVYAKGVTDSKKMATEGVLTTIPDIVKHNVTLMTTLAEARNNFYKENEDLIPFQAVVAAVFEEVAAKNADKKIGDIMKLVAPEVRTRLQLKKNAVKNEKEEKKEDKNNPPRLHGSKGGNQRGNQREKPNTSSLASEIAAMNKALGY